VADDAVHKAIVEAMIRAGLFDVVARANDESELVTTLEMQDPDLLVIDEDLGHGNIGGVVASASAGRPIPALVLVPTETPIHRASQGQDRLSYLGKDVLIGGGLAGSSQVFARLVAAAGLIRTRRRTQTANSLMEAIRRERVKHRHVEQRPEVTTLAAWPLDLVVLVGAEGSRDVLETLLSRVSGLPVPVLVAVTGKELPSAAAWSKAKPPVLVLDSQIDLRRANGFVVVPSGGEGRIEGERIVVRPGPGATDGVLDTIASAGRLRSGGLTILMAGEDPELAMALAGPVNEGGIAAVVDPDQTSAPAAGQAAVEWGLVALQLSIDEIVWILSRTIPRRS
jgi:hypothetical protein